MRDKQLTCADCGAVWITQRARKCLDGKFRCKRCNHSRLNKKYAASDKGKAAEKRKSQTDSFKARQKRYLQSDKGKAKQLRYAQSEKGKVVFATKNRKRYWNDPEYYRKKALERMHDIEDYKLEDKCGWCGTTENLSLDHGHPQSKGGKGVAHNLYTLCISCNSFKQDHLVTAGDYPGVMR